MVKLIWTLPAAKHFEKICEYIEQDAPQAATKFAREITALIDTIPASPLGGPIVPEYNETSIRERLFRGKYRIIYRVTRNAVEILAIVHGSRLLENALEKPINRDGENDVNT